MICENGNGCDHPFCPEHSDFDPWEGEDFVQLENHSKIIS